MAVGLRFRLITLYNQKINFFDIGKKDRDFSVDVGKEGKGSYVGNFPTKSGRLAALSIFEALRKTGVNKTYIHILENICKEVTDRVHIDNHVSEPFRIERGVRQGDPISPKLFTAAVDRSKIR